MTMPGAKEQFMQQLNDFFSRNIPKMKAYFEDLLTQPFEHMPITEVVETTDTVRNNALAQLWDHIHTNEKKLRANFDTIEETDVKNDLHKTMSELMELYPKKPKKASEKEGKKDKKDKGGDD
jgi:NDP-sugar pyrophosphorylase family protein